MGFKEQRDRVYQKAHESTLYFAEVCEHRAASTDEWTVVTVHVKHSAQGEEDQGLREVEQLLVRFNRDDLAGLSRGHQLRRAAAVDPDRRPFTWTGEVDEKYPHKQRLVFERPRLTQLQ